MNNDMKQTQPSDDSLQDTTQSKTRRVVNKASELSRQLFFTRIGLMIVSMLLVSLVLSLVLSYYVTQRPISSSTNSQVVELPRGASAKTMAAKLHQAGMLDRPQAFVWYVRLKQQAHLLKPGEFNIDPAWNFAQLMQVLVEGRNVSYPFTLVPGETWSQVREKLAGLPKITLETDPLKWQALAQSVQGGLEGWLLPESYHYHKGDTDFMLVRRALESMQQALNAEWASRDGGLPIQTPYEALILASIIEKETGVAHERHQVAGVFVRRLQKRMRLQTDPTVIYGMGERYQGRLRSQDLRELTPYNTYRINGLPPTPIAMPSRESIHAALHPDDSDALYFVAKGNGEHYFSSNLQEHNRAVRRYILNQAY